MKTKIVELNNKSRKGTYIYIKEKGKPARYYKKRGLLKEEEKAKDYYDKRYVKKQKVKPWYTRKKRTKKEKKIVKTKKTIRKTIKKYKKLGEITEFVRKGIHSVDINNPHKMTNQQKRNKIMELAEKATKKEKDKNVLSNETNLNKIKNRTEFLVIGYNERGDITFKANRYGVTLMQAIIEVRTSLLTEQDSREGYTDPVIQNLESKGWKNTTTETTGRTTAIKMTMTIRKG